MEPYNSYTPNRFRYQRWVPVVYVLVVLFALYQLGSAIYYLQTTGVLRASSPGASLAVIQENHRPVVLGTSTAQARLQPGNYTLIASKNRQQITRTVVVRKKQTTTINLGRVGAASGAATTDIATNKLTNLLPLYGPNYEFVIDYRYTFSGGVAKPIIVITSDSAQGVQDAQAWIQTQGYKLSSLNIQYNNASAVPTD